MTKKITVSEITSVALRSQVYEEAFPEYYELSNIIENNLWHDNQSVLNHVIGVFAGLEKLLKFENIADDKKKFAEEYLTQVIGSKTRLDILKVATLLHDIAKNDTLVKRANGTADCPGHELIGAARVGNFSDRFDLDDRDEEYVERVVRYHGLISQILGLIIANGNKEVYLQIFMETVGDVALELVLLMHADLLGSDLESGDKQEYDERIKILVWMFDQLSDTIHSNNMA
jgi:hypothetical protein